MPLKLVFERLEILAATSSTNEKVSLLKEYLKDSLFKRTIKFALDGDKKYKIKKFPPYKPICSANQTVEKIFDFLVQFSIKAGVSDVEKQMLFAAASKNKETYEVVKRICKKDLRCGVNAKLVNKAVPRTIHLIPYMRCSTDKKLNRIKYPAIAQEKADGMFVNLMINRRGQIRFITRNGMIVYQLNPLKNIIRPHTNSIYLNNRVFTGELILIVDGKILPRKQGNGILNQAIHNTANSKDMRNVHLHIWDTLPLPNFYTGEYNKPYEYRLMRECLSAIDVVDDPHFSLVKSKFVDSFEEANEMYLSIREAGGEGIILKNTKGVWKNHTSPNQIKIKNVSDAELRIVGWIPGKKGTKYEHCLGALICETDDRQVRVSVGSGFTDEEREMNWGKYVNKIVTVEYESLIKDKKRDTYSLFLPRFKELRSDKDETDTIEELKYR